MYFSCIPKERDVSLILGQDPILLHTNDKNKCQIISLNLFSYLEFNNSESISRLPKLRICWFGSLATASPQEIKSDATSSPST